MYISNREAIIHKLGIGAAPIGEGESLTGWALHSSTRLKTQNALSSAVGLRAPRRGEARITVKFYKASNVGSVMTGRFETSKIGKRAAVA